MRRNTRTRMLTEASVERIVAMGAQLKADTSLLRQALAAGLPAVEDPKRKGFYTVECHGTAWYIHFREAAKTVYVVGRLGNADLEAPPTWATNAHVMSPCAP